MRKRTTDWSTLDSQLDDFFDDASGGEIGQEYSQSLRVTSWNWAQRQLAMHTPRQRSVTLTIHSNRRSALLPEDFLAIRRIYDADGSRWLERVTQQKGRRLADEELDLYWVWQNKLLFERSYEISSTDLTLYYWAYWPEVEQETIGEDITNMADAVVVPPWSLLPLCHLTAAIVLQPGAVDAARLNEWKIKVDSGRPTDNPREIQAKAHWWWWNELMSKMKPQDWRV